MKKFKSILLAGLVVLGFAACNNEDVIDGSDEGDKVTGYLTLTFNSGSMNDSKLKTTPHQEPPKDATEAGTGNEIVISDVTVVLTDANGIITEVVTPSIEQGTTKTVEFPVEVGNHKVFALVNNPLADGSIKKNENIQRVVAAGSAKAITEGFSGGSFFMTNSQSDKDKGFMDAAEDAAITAGETTNVKVNVDRLAARIDDKTVEGDIKFVGLSQEIVDKGIMKYVKVSGFVPLNLNKSMNLIQSWGKDNTGGVAITENVLQTPAINITDPTTYFYGSETYKNAAGTVDLTIDTENYKGPAFGEKVYVTENRPIFKYNDKDEVDAQRGQATGVIYKVQAVNDQNKSETFYVYNNVIYTDRTELDKFFKDNGNVDISQKTPEELRERGISVYENGIMYYTYFIEDPNSNYQVGGKDYYGTFRNSIYKLSIKNISNLGYDVPENQTDKPDPIKPSTAHMTVEVEINDWVLNEIGINF